jgi:hypothetical protein
MKSMIIWWMQFEEYIRESGIYPPKREKSTIAFRNRDFQGDVRWSIGNGTAVIDFLLALNQE